MQGRAEMYWFFYRLFAERPKGAEPAMGPGIKSVFAIGLGLISATSAIVFFRSMSRKPVLASLAGVQAVAAGALSVYSGNQAYQQHTYYEQLWAEEYETLRRERRERKLKNGEEVA